MQLAHESILTGHLSVTSGVHTVLSKYYWPGIYITQNLIRIKLKFLFADGPAYLIPNIL